MTRETWKGLAIGFGAGLLAPLVLPAVARAGRPTLDAAIRAGLGAWERGREVVAEFGEYAEDMMAEARARQDGGAAMGGQAVSAGGGEAGSA